MSRPTVVKGFQLIGVSILLTSYAQLAMKWGMVRLPEPTHWLSLEMPTSADGLAMGIVASGLVAYLLSMVFWINALARLPLNRAYPVLGLSYSLVYLAGVALPWYQESISPQGMVGVVLITAGVMLIGTRGAR